METQKQARLAREYETIYIMNPAVDPDEADKVASRVAEVVERLSGKLTKVDNWGKRKLAYPIAKSSRGVFVYLRYVGYGDLVPELERNLRMLDSVIRYQTVALEEDVNLAELKVDPEEVKFQRLEVTEDEEEPGLEQRLGLAGEIRSRSHHNDLDEVEDEDAELVVDDADELVPAIGDE